MKFNREKCGMLLMKSGKKTNNGTKRTGKSRKKFNTWRKGKLEVFGNT